MKLVLLNSDKIIGTNKREFRYKAELGNISSCYKNIFSIHGFDEKRITMCIHTGKNKYRTYKTVKTINEYEEVVKEDKLEYCIFNGIYKNNEPLGIGLHFDMNEITIVGKDNVIDEIVKILEQ